MTWTRPSCLPAAYPRELLDDPRYYEYREEVLAFLAAFEHPPQAVA